MRWLVCLAAVVWVFAPAAHAQEQPSYEQLKKLYDDAVKQMDMAQKRKNELSAENEALKAKVGELTKDLGDVRQQLVNLQKDAAEWANRTLLLRAHHAAWKTFVRRYPHLWARWEVYLEGRLPESDNSSDCFAAPAPTTAPATQPKGG